MSTPLNISGILCAGRLYCDLVFTGAPRLPTLGTETFADGLGLHAGGGAYITAATLAALGQPAALTATLPAAPFSDIVTQEIVSSGVDVSRCQNALPGTEPQITVAIVTGDDRAFLSRRSGPALPDLNITNLNGMQHLHIGELRTLLDSPDLITMARSAGMTISLDCGWDDELLSERDGLAELIAKVDVFLPNQAEADRLGDLGLPDRLAPVTVIKCGSAGAKALGRSGWISASARLVKTVDATGAGDAFNGGFLSEWLAGQSLEQCLATGNTCGAIAVQARGGTGGTEQLRKLSSTPDIEIAG